MDIDYEIAKLEEDNVALIGRFLSLAKELQTLENTNRALAEEIVRIRRYRNEILEEAALNAEGFGGSTNDAKNYWAQEISESIRELKRKKPDGYR